LAPCQKADISRSAQSTGFEATRKSKDEIEGVIIGSNDH
jgi:hypothetical protein